MNTERFDTVARLLAVRRSRRTALAGGVALTASLATLWRRKLAAQDATPSSTCPTTSVEDNVAHVRRFFDELWNGSNLDLIDELVAEDVVRHFANQPAEGQAGRDALAERIRERRMVNFPDYQVTVEDIFGEGDLVVSRTHWTGTHADDLEQHADVSTAATGKAVSHSGIAMFCLACGKIAEQWIANDELGLLQQIGAIPAPNGVTTPIAQVGSTASSAAGSPASCAATTPEENKRHVQRLYDEVFNAHDLTAVDELHAEDHHAHNGSRQATEATDDIVETHLAEWLNDFPDLQMTIEAMIAAGDEVAVRWSATGTHQGDFEQAGVAATGRSVQFGGMAIYRLACGEIAETWNNWDALDLYRQLIADTATPES